jgi:hypothetical protein
MERELAGLGERARRGLSVSCIYLAVRLGA